MQNPLLIEDIIFDAERLAFTDNSGNIIVHGSIYSILMYPFDVSPKLIQTTFDTRYGADISLSSYKQYGLFRGRASEEIPSHNVYLITEILERK